MAVSDNHTTKIKSRAVIKARRAEYVRAAVVAGMTNPEIVDALRDGIPDGQGGRIACSQATAYRDLEELSARWRQLADDPEVIEREVGSARERLKRLAVEAADRAFRVTEEVTTTVTGKGEDQVVTTRTVRRAGGASWARVALQAEQRLLELVGTRSARWRRDRELTADDAIKATPAVEAAAKLAARMEDAGDQELIETLQELRRRSGLVVIEGGAVAAGD